MLGIGALAEVGLADEPLFIAPLAVAVNRTNAANSRTIVFGQVASLGVSRTNPANSRGVSFRVPVPNVGNRTFTNPATAAVSRTNLPAARTIVFNGGLAGGSGVFYIALVNATDSTFGPTMERYDLAFTKAVVSQKEGQKATLTIDVKNPGVGLLTLPEWIWFSWVDTEGTSTLYTGQPAGTVYPIFFGHILSIPQTPIGEKVTLVYVAEPNDAIFQLQQVAQGLKDAGLYDPVFIGATKRDDPEQIIRAYTKSYHFPRLATPNSVNTSDWITGEDGNLSFLCSDGTSTAGDVPYASFTQRTTTSPLIACRVEADVSWRQVATNIIDMGTNSFSSYMDGIYSQWPKAGTQLGGGYSVWAAVATDVNEVHETVQIQQRYNYQNNDTVHTDGDVLTNTASISWPLLPGPSLKFTVTNLSVGGFFQPPSDFGPGVNKPTEINITYSYVPRWDVNTSLQLRADVNRLRKETFGCTVTADVQAILGQTASTPLSDLDTETIPSVHGADVGAPLINPLYWTSIAGQVVRRGTVMFPNALSMPGGMTLQIALNDGGTAGTTIPASFSDVVGEVTVDGTVQWASLGPNALLTAINWTPSTSAPTGQVIAPTLPPYVNYQDLVGFGLSQDPPIGTDVALYQIVYENGAYYQCSLEGATNQGTVDGSGSFTPPSPVPAFNATPGAQTADGSVIWTCIGPTLPNGTNYYLCLSGGLTADFMPDFSVTSGATFTDGSVTWLCLGVCPGYLPPPVGGTPGNITSPTFFGTTYGQTISAPYLIGLDRARLIYRSRAYESEWNCIWDKALLVTLRKTATIADQRIPGGTATGKIVAYDIIVDGERSYMGGHVKIAVPIGNGGTASAGDGQALLPTNDLAFDVPEWTPNDDGLTFPLTKSQVVVTEATHGSLSAQTSPLNTAMNYQSKLAQLVAVTASYGQSVSIDEQITIARTPFTVDRMMKGLDVWYELDLKPVTGSTFTEDFEPMTTPLKITQGVQLDAASN